MLGQHMKAAGVVAVVLACNAGCINNALLGVDVCGKECSTASDCGTGYTCDTGTCAGDPCGGGVNVGSGSSGVVTASSNPASSASLGNSSSVQASSALSSSAASSGSTTLSSSSRPASSSLTGTSTSRPVSSSSAASGTSSATSLPASSSSSNPGPCVGHTAGDPCGTNLFCDASLNCISACVIGGQVVPSGTADPASACRSCQPSRSTSGYRWIQDGTACSTGDACTTGMCQSGQCNGSPVCTGATPQCSGGTCSCTNSPVSSCLGQNSNKRCLANGSCGCNGNSDCGFGEQCDTTAHVCNPCNALDACGFDCQPCRSAVSMTVNRGHYLTCNGNGEPAAFACVINTCASGTANCNQDDTDQCEVTTSSDAANCGVCELACSSGTCSAGHCSCPQSGNQCPSFNGNQQGCSNNSCRCADSSECPSGTTCDTNSGRRLCRYP